MDTREIRRSFRRFTYRHPSAWSTIKRAAAVGALVGGLGLRARKLRGLAVSTSNRMQALHARRNLAGPQRNPKAISRGIRRMRALRRAYDVRASRFGGAAKIIGAGGIGYAGIPAAREIGQRRRYRYETRNAKPVTVIRKIHRGS